jgi:hypothetical protein
MCLVLFTVRYCVRADRVRVIQSHCVPFEVLACIRPRPCGFCYFYFFRYFVTFVLTPSAAAASAANFNACTLNYTTSFHFPCTLRVIQNDRKTTTHFARNNVCACASVYYFFLNFCCCCCTEIIRTAFRVLFQITIQRTYFVFV